MDLRGRPISPGGGHAAGRALLEEMYRARTGEAMPPVLTDGAGKPYFENSPWHFSITHTGRHVFCALSSAPVGIDGEELDRAVSPGLAEKVLSPGEYRQYREAADQNRALLTFWVLKEARAKLLGTGLTGYPNHTDFLLNDPRVTVRDGCLLAVLEEAAYAV